MRQIEKLNKFVIIAVRSLFVIKAILVFLFGINCEIIKVCNHFLHKRLKINSFSGKY